MFRHPILINRPMKPKKAAVYRPGVAPLVADDTVESPAGGIKRASRLSEKLSEARALR